MSKIDRSRRFPLNGDDKEGEVASVSDAVILNMYAKGDGGDGQNWRFRLFGKAILVFVISSVYPRQRREEEGDVAIDRITPRPVHQSVLLLFCFVCISQKRTAKLFSPRLT